MATTHLFLPPASLLPLLHAARYPSSTVIGCLVGQSQVAKDGEDSEAQDDTPTRRYEHAIPLLHHWTGLSMAVEVAMQLIEEYLRLQAATKQKEWEVLGFYFANEGLSSDARKPKVPAVVKSLVEQCITSSINPTVLMLNNTSLSSPEKAFTLLDPTSASFTPLSDTITFFKSPSQNASPSRLPLLIKAKQHLLVEDFDEHLEDIGATWLGNERVDLNPDA